MARAETRRRARVGAGLVLAAVTALSASASMAQDWPDGARAAVALTYDDAMASQLDVAIPELDAAGLTGVFFLSRVKVEDIGRWRAAAASGHELANHTLFHPCSAATFPTDPHQIAEAYTVRSMLDEIAQQNVLLAAIDGRTRRGFATPCGQSLAGDVDYLEALAATGMVIYSRGVTPEVADIRALDRMRIPARGFGADATGDDLIAFVQEAMESGGMAVFLFHDVGGDHLPVSREAHAELTAWLAAHRSEVWTTTLLEAVDWLERAR